MTNWRKSSHSDETGGECVELATLPHVVAIRDSMAPDTGHLTLTREGFAVLLAHVKRTRFPADAPGPPTEPRSRQGLCGSQQIQAQY